VVYAKPVFGGPLQVLRYLMGRYTHRVAISNHRLLAFEHERVTFRWKNYAHGGKQGQVTLAATEFLRRFFLHVLPKHPSLRVSGEPLACLSPGAVPATTRLQLPYARRNRRGQEAGPYY
jgi:Putative transposase